MASLEQRADHLVSGLLRRDRRDELEQYRFRGSTNRVYWIPLGDDSDEFIIVKLLPRWPAELRMALKRPVRNLLYGEHDARVGRGRVQWEIERYREWRAAGIPVPPLVETSLPGVRIIKGMPLPTFYTLLSSPEISEQQKLAMLRYVTRSLSQQHRAAVEWERKSLVHREPGPWNILVDVESDMVYWYDLEHPVDYPGMTIEELMVRGLRIFAYGVLDHLPNRFEEVLAIIAEEYEPRHRLWELALSLERSLRARPQRVARRLGLRKERFIRQERIASQLSELVAKAA